MSNDLDDFVVVVTGASTGLGRAIAVEAARRGAKAVVVNYARSGAQAEETAGLVKAQGATPILVEADVRVDADCRRIAEAAAPYGRLDALFNNAGVTRFSRNHADLEALSEEDFVEIYRTNVVGAFQMIRAARPLLEAAKAPGAVVNTSSLAAVNGMGSSIAYAASKGALNTMTLSLARALAPKIRVNAICPGYIDTEWFARGLGEDSRAGIRQSVRQMTALRAASTAEDIADTAVFLGSPQSRHVVGETLVVDAGLKLGVSPVEAEA